MWVGCSTRPYCHCKMAQPVKSLISSVLEHQRSKCEKKQPKATEGLRQRCLRPGSRHRFSYTSDGFKRSCTQACERLRSQDWCFSLMTFILGSRPRLPWALAAFKRSCPDSSLNLVFYPHCRHGGKQKPANIAERGVIHAGPPGEQFNLALQQISRLKLNSIITVME